jgi:predicted DNA-binding transcriptional regulator AlpA
MSHDSEVKAVLDAQERERQARLDRASGRDAADRPTRARSDRLLSAAEVADYLGVERSFVYEHASELGVRRLGDGPKAPLRFKLSAIDKWLSACSACRESSAPEPASVLASRPPRRKRMGTNVVLLPVRGEKRDSDDVRSAA